MQAVANALVLDPVMEIDFRRDGFDRCRRNQISGGEELLKRATVVTPNIAAGRNLFRGIQIKDYLPRWKRPRARSSSAAHVAVVVKGGHMEKRDRRVLFDGSEVLALGGERLKSGDTRMAQEANCTFASAIAAQLAAMRASVARSRPACKKPYVTKAIEKGFSIGKGPGPLESFLTGFTPGAAGVRGVPNEAFTQHGMTHFLPLEPGAH